MIEKKSWKEFQDAGLLWWINRILHLFGWAIVFSFNEDDGSIVDVYPARCKFRGFREEHEEHGFRQLSRYMDETSATLKKEAEA